jgi:recombinational DNA repair protein (RecF pathway)
LHWYALSGTLWRILVYEILMIWQDKGFLLHQNAFGERQFIATFLTEHHGRYRGLVRDKKIQFIPGALYDIVWKSRIEDHLGLFSLDAPYGLIWTMMNHQGALRAVNLMCCICTHILPERVSMPVLYDVFGQTLDRLATPDGLRAYDYFETILLQELGYDPIDRHPGEPLWKRLYRRQREYLNHWPHLHRLHRMRRAFIDDVIKIIGQIP